ncbi:DUF6585 family protein [Zavarzinella formosa]|uniref:DUF6585 family protein n=1 Tax=Zavarzinella formosa TaxID=360055 RepID=UPI0003183578|nr:DUF6585 family protein [Zavarzinella formosa]
MDEDEEESFRRSARLKQALALHGEDTIEEYESDLLDTLVLSLPSLLALVLFAGAVTGVVLSSDWLRWVSVGVALLLAKLAFDAVRAIGWLAQNHGWMALVYDDRLVLRHDSDVREYFWEDMEAVYVHSRAARTEFFWEEEFPNKVWMETWPPRIRFWREWIEIQTNDGSRVRIPSGISEYEGLIATIQSEVSDRLLNGLRQRFHAGESLAFGPFTVRPTGLEVDGELLEWERHRETWTHKNLFCTDNWEGVPLGKHVPLEEVPNPGMVVMLVTDITSDYIYLSDEDEEDEDGEE